MKYIENETSAHLLVWETNPRLRNKNNEVQLVVHNNTPINVGDVIFRCPTDETTSSYEITEILKSRPAALKEHTHFTVKTKWKMRSTLEIVQAPDKITSAKTEFYGEKLMNPEVL